MRYMMHIRHAEGGEMPPQALFDAMEVFIREQVKAGVLVDTAGLAPTADGVRVRMSNRKLRMIDGPFTESKEIVGGYAIVNADSREDAIRTATAFMQLHLDHFPTWEGECEVRQIMEAPILEEAANA